MRRVGGWESRHRSRLALLSSPGPRSIRSSLLSTLSGASRQGTSGRAARAEHDTPTQCPWIAGTVQGDVAQVTFQNEGRATSSKAGRCLPRSGQTRSSSPKVRAEVRRHWFEYSLKRTRPGAHPPDLGHFRPNSANSGPASKTLGRMPKSASPYQFGPEFGQRWVDFDQSCPERDHIRAELARKRPTSFGNTRQKYWVGFQVWPECGQIRHRDSVKLGSELTTVWAPTGRQSDTLVVERLSSSEVQNQYHFSILPVPAQC